MDQIDWRKVLMTGAGFYFAFKILPRPVVFLGVLSGTYLITQKYKNELEQLRNVK